MTFAPGSWREDPLLTALACAAVEPGLRSVVLFDATAQAALWAAHWLAEMVARVERLQPRVAIIHASETEEEIWGALALQRAGGGGPIRWRRGVLGLPDDAGEARVVMVHDLARINLVAARAAVAQIGSEVSVLERDGQSAAWRPSTAWVARLARAEVGEVSPHLLDRFSLRVPLAPEPPTDRVAEILAWSGAAGPVPDAPPPPLPPELLDTLERLGPRPPSLAGELLPQVLSHFAPGTTAGLRRPLMLARFARALAWLSGDAEVAAGHLAEAARRAGLSSLEPAAAAPAPAAPEAPHENHASLPPPIHAAPEAPMRGPVAVPAPSSAPVAQPADGPPGVEPLVEPEEQAFPASSIASPYPEDTAPAAREAFPLRLPSTQGRDPARAGGVPIGTQPARRARDIAVVSTVVEAAKFQRVRPPLPGGGMRITPADLRSYRRVPIPRQVLAIVMDYTALGDCDWAEALVPHLARAYVQRASVTLVQVGARGAADPLRAGQINARSLLSPQVRAALDEEAGTATPLAHGLDLAARSLRRAFQQGRARAHNGVLVVLTDGRGNVPLEASLSGQVTGRITRQGVDDALAVARQLGGLKNLTRVLLHPRPQQYASLPLELAEAMGATAEAMELRTPQVEGA